MATNVSPILREAHRLRKHLAELRTEIERGPRVLKAHQTKFAKQEQALRDSQEHIKKLQLHIREKDVSLKTFGTQIRRYEGQRDGSTNAKEIEAFNHQIEFAKKQSAELEEEIFAHMTELDEKSAQLPVLQQELQAAKSQFAEFEKDAQTRHARLVQEVQLAETELKSVEANLAPEAKGMYDRLIAAYKETALASAKGRVCHHCRTQITETQLMELTAGAFMCCKSCGRGLYLAD